MPINFRDPATAVMEGIIDFHHDVQVYLIIIVTFVAWMLFSLLYEFGSNMRVKRLIWERFQPFFLPKKYGEFKYGFTHVFFKGTDEPDVISVLYNRKYSMTTKSVTHGVILEIVWTILPVFVLIAIAFPSFALLYSIDEIIDPSLTIKVIGHQWYWSYEYTDYENNNVGFDSYMVPEEDLQEGELRLLEVDRKMWLPVNTHIRLLITSTDVLHAWAIPAFGVKMDAVPGRLNQVCLFIKREGIFYGQCSELCGVNHGFMPISVKVVQMELFTTWINFLFNK